VSAIDKNGRCLSVYTTNGVKVNLRTHSVIVVDANGRRRVLSAVEIFGSGKNAQQGKPTITGLEGVTDVLIVANEHVEAFLRDAEQDVVVVSVTVDPQRMRGRHGRLNLNPGEFTDAEVQLHLNSPGVSDADRELTIAKSGSDLTGGREVEQINPRGQNTFLHRGIPIVGFEVTDPKYQESLASNIDPQHGPDVQPGAPAAITAALTADLPPEGAVFTTQRPDADALGAMAVMELRLRYPAMLKEPTVLARIERIAVADTSAVKAWARTVPGTGPDWKDGVYDPQVSETATLGKMCSNFKNPMSERLETMAVYLATGTFSGKDELEAELKAAQVAAREEFDEVYATRAGVARGVSRHPGATGVLYEFSPVVVATNPEMKTGPGEPYVKHTVARYNNGVGWERDRLLRELNEAEVAGGGEPGWGGTPDIIGSPQGTDSRLTNKQVAEIVGSCVNLVDMDIHTPGPLSLTPAQAGGFDEWRASRSANRSS
jgi:hypothetical protein